jgi:phytoene dehydrogenase-like protein
MAHTLSQSAFFRPKNYSSKVSGLYYAGHNTLPGIGLPMCLISAELVLKHLTNDRSSGPTPGEITPLPREAWVGLEATR